MCLLFVYINPNPGKDEYKLILVNNRDECYSRPTQCASIWEGEPKIIAGKDLQQDRMGGTWLGVSDTGKVASLLNILASRDTFKDPGTVEGRGFLVVNYLAGKLSGEEYMQQLAESTINYNKFSIVIIEPNTSLPTSDCSSVTEQPYKLLYFNNIEKEVMHIGSGIHGFGNSCLSKPFIKIEKGKQKLERILKETGLSTRTEEQLIELLLKMMQDQEQNYPDEAICQQGAGYPEQILRQLSCIWVADCPNNYGTRTTTVVLVDSNNRAVLRERTMKEPVDIKDVQWVQTHHTISINL